MISKYKGVTVNMGTVEALDYAKLIPEEQWPRLVIRRSSHCRTMLTAGCRDLLRFLEEADELQMWKTLGYSDLAEFIREGLRIDPVLIGWALDGLNVMSPDEATPFIRLAPLLNSLRPRR